MKEINGDLADCPASQSPNDAAPVEKKRFRGRPPLDDAQLLAQMSSLLRAGSATSDWEAARIASESAPGNSREAAQWRLYKKHRLKKVAEPFSASSAPQVSDEDRSGSA